uniref:NADH-ubiquinone oxidoreductase chain 1 n=1 Tax=Calisoga longitarsis TaxID=394809 RepID=B2CKV6_9ARAC|nr:NADH dehydrogenase subunit 1 [Calisoga longitarsis]
MFSILFLLIIVSSLISVAFYTVVERKVLGYIQIRKGPNKVGILGVFQPFSDAIKLFSKSIVVTEQMNIVFSSTSPALIFILSIIILPLIPYSKFGIFDSSFSILNFFIISSMSVYMLLLIGWSANSKFCYLGSIRGVAQMISYEVSFFLLFLTLAMMSHSYSFFNFNNFYKSPYLFSFSLLFGIWVITCLAETNRSPFDFAEGESELVSGFNVEYMGGWFALIFLAEYLSMLILSMISVVVFFGTLTKFINLPMIIIMSLSFLWVRGTFPRFRYDLLMLLNWKVFLPLVIPTLMISIPMMFISS